MGKARRREERGILGQAWCEEAESDVTVQGGGAVGRREDWLLRKASICLPRPAGQEQHGAHFTKAISEAGRPARQEHLLVRQAKNRTELKRGPGE